MVNTRVLGISGKKQAGKNTAANFILGSWLKSLELVNDFKIKPNGQLWVSDIFGQPEYSGIFDINDSSQAMLNFRAKNLDDIIRIYSFADYLKEVCINILGLSYEQCYGSNEDKNSLTHLKWEDMPGIASKDQIEAHANSYNCSFYNPNEDDYNYAIENLGIKYHTSGRMTAREVLQFVGTEIFRKMYNNVWVDALIRKIERERPTLAIITDIRFPNECDSILDLTGNLEGQVIRLTRNIFDDNHPSETALDKYPIAKLIYVDNQNLTIQEQNAAIQSKLEKINWWPKTLPKNIEL